MAVNTITYANKVTLNENPNIDAVNKCQASDMNEIKNVVNNNATEMGLLQYAPVSLFSNTSGTTGTVTLSDSAANYSYFEIFCVDINGISSSVKIQNPNGKTANLMVANVDTGIIQFYTKNILISDTSISNVRGYTVKIQNASITAYNNSNDYILITGVIGYK